MSDDLRLLFESLGMSMFEHDKDPRGVLGMLMSETLKFRDKLKEDTGYTLTVADTRTALDALDQRTHGQPLPDDLTDEQKALVQIWMDRLTIFQ
jgi:hypothetical protein